MTRKRRALGCDPQGPKVTPSPGSTIAIIARTGGAVVDLDAERRRRRGVWPWPWRLAPPCTGTCRCWGAPLGGQEAGRWPS